jgi:hypothetical protein
VDKTGAGESGCPPGIPITGGMVKRSPCSFFVFIVRWLHLAGRVQASRVMIPASSCTEWLPRNGMHNWPFDFKMLKISYVLLGSDFFNLKNLI